jgi:hypothetical protein
MGLEISFWESYTVIVESEKFMTFLTIFSAPKGFTNPHINIIQRNAIQSWMHLGPEVDVFLIGAEEGMAEAANELGVKVLSEVERNAWGTPLVNSIFSLAGAASESPILTYVNADILLMPQFVEVARVVASQVQSFLVVGQRWDLAITQLLDFDQGWDQQLRDRTLAEGELHRPVGSDYFIYPRDLFDDMPGFAIGRSGWDNWMIYKSLVNGWHVIDATSALMVIHQDHDYSHLPGGKPPYDLEETKINAALGGGYRNMYMTLDTNYELIDGVVRRSRWTRDRILRRLERMFQPKDDNDRGIRWWISRRFKRMRRGIL